MRKNYHRFLIGVLLVFISMGCFAQIPELAVRLESRDENSLLISFILENNSSSSVKVLTWNTPLEEDFNADSFLVVFNGEETTQIKYIERLLKRGQPGADDYVILQPGEVISTELDISQGYATYAAGEYIIRFQSVLELQNLSDTSGESHSVKLISEPLTAYQGFELSAVQANKDQRSTSCSTSQNATIQQAWNAAKTLATDSVNVLNATAEAQRASATRYTTWFGAYQASRYSTVSTHFNQISDALDNRPLEFICNSSRCGSGTFAFVYSGSPYEIYLCESFWNASLTGTDSKAGTIIHELSHFDVIAATDDHVYGQSGARQLALSDPNTAINNADSHEYFAENTPALSMDSGGGTPPSTGSQQLTLGVPVSGSVNISEWAYYEVTGATSVRLYNLTADIDLYIGNGGQPTTDNYVCRPYAENTTEETCTITGNSSTTTYVGVRGYRAGSYSLVATGGASSGGGTPPSTGSQPLTLGVPVSGSVNTSEWAYYEVTGATSVRLYNLTADIDLYIGNGGQPTTDNYVCRPYAENTTEETCTITGNSSTTTYVGVRGYRAGSYSLVATGGASSGGGGAANTTRVQLNQTGFNLGNLFQMNMVVSGNGAFDTYAGVIFPDGSLYTFSPPFSLNPVNTILPYHHGLTLNGEQTFTILNITLPGSLPRGTYQACSLMIPQGLSTAVENWTSVYCEEFVIR